MREVKLLVVYVDQLEQNDQSSNDAGRCCFESATLFLGELPVMIHWFSNHQDWGLASY